MQRGRAGKGRAFFDNGLHRLQIRQPQLPLRLRQHLQTRPWLAGERFTVADICVASVVAWVAGASDLMAQCPQVSEWLQRCLARPAYQTVRELAKSA